MKVVEPVRNLSGHTLGKGIIHNGKSVPLVGGGSWVEV